MTDQQKFIDLLVENGFTYLDNVTLEKAHIFTQIDGKGDIQLIPGNAEILIAMAALSLMLKRK